MEQLKLPFKKKEKPLRSKDLFLRLMKEVMTGDFVFNDTQIEQVASSRVRIQRPVRFRRGIYGRNNES